MHLPTYIKRFGPAILYATEGFESYNFLIRLRSVHSNRHAPSSDIGDAFAFLHAVRHLVSGGYVEVEDEQTHIVSRRQAGDGVRMLIGDPIFRHLMGMDGILEMNDIGEATLIRSDRRTDTYYIVICIGRTTVPSKEGSKPFADSHTAKAGFVQIASPQTVVLPCERIQLHNGDAAYAQQWVIYNSPGVPSAAPPIMKCGRVQEILLRVSDSTLLGVLINKATVSMQVEKPYRLPPIKVTSPPQWEFLSLTVSVLFVYFVTGISDLKVPGATRHGTCLPRLCHTRLQARKNKVSYARTASIG